MTHDPSDQPSEPEVRPSGRGCGCAPIVVIIGVIGTLLVMMEAKASFDFAPRGHNISAFRLLLFGWPVAILQAVSGLIALTARRYGLAIIQAIMAVVTLASMWFGTPDM